jgi:hypothetical protein
MISYNGYINDYIHVKCVVRYKIKFNTDGLVVPSDSPCGHYNSFYRTDTFELDSSSTGE